MIRYLLDTNVVSEPARPDPSGRVVRRLEKREGELALPSVAWHELIYGAYRLKEGQRRSYLTEYLTDVVRPSMPILPYDGAAARWHGKARAALEAAGRPTPFADGQIAAIAATRDLVLVTRNTSDFEPFVGVSEEKSASGAEEELRLENWFEE